MTQPKKPSAAAGVRCSFCGRRNTVRPIEDKLYFCSHCDRMFKA